MGFRIPFAERFKRFRVNRTANKVKLISVSLGAIRGKGIQFPDMRQTFRLTNSKFRTMRPKGGGERSATPFEVEVWKSKYVSDLT